MKLLLLATLPVALYAQPTPKFTIQVVDNQINIGYGMAIGDVDGDRRPDILLADQKQFVWYKNPGKKDATWTRYVMAENLTEQDNVCIAARDLTGDGRVEVAVGAGWDPSQTSDSTRSGAVFYLQRPDDPTQLWEPLRLPHEVTTHRMRWAKVGKRYQLIVVPLHGFQNKNGEGRATPGRGVKIWGYEFPQRAGEGWNRHVLDSSMHMTHNLEIWEDGDQTRVMIAGKEGAKLVAWRNGRWQDTGRWLGQGNGMGELRREHSTGAVATVEPMHGNKLVYYAGAATFPKPPVTITDQLSQGHALLAGDFLGVGREQLVVGWRNPNTQKQVGVRLFRPDGGEKWTEFSLDDSVRMACEDLQMADLDGDGDLDVVASGRATLNVLIYWNQRR